MVKWISKCKECLELFERQRNKNACKYCCDACRKKARTVKHLKTNNWQKIRYEMKGLCPKCGKEILVPGYSACQKCSDRKKELRMMRKRIAKVKQ